METLLAEAAITVRTAAAMLQSRRAEISRIQATEEGGREVKLLADEVTDTVILAELKKTGLEILSEEAGLIPATDSSTKLRWVVDPLDGSLNFLRGISYCGISVGLCKGSTPVAGIIYDLATNRLVTGMVGQGAAAEGNAIHPAPTADPAQAVLSTGFPARMNYGEKNLQRFIGQIQQFRKIRMLGSAVQSCLHIADGRMDAYFEQDTMLWDIAAGTAIIQAAGGHVELAPGSRENAFIIWACAPGLTPFKPA